MKYLKQSLLLGFLGLTSAFAAEESPTSPKTQGAPLFRQLQLNEVSDDNDPSTPTPINLLEVQKILKTANMLETEKCLKKIRIGLVDEEKGNSEGVIQPKFRRFCDTPF